VISKHCLARGKRGKRFTIIAIAEGARPIGGQQVVDKIIVDSPDRVRLGGIGAVLGEQIEKMTGLETRSVLLGHVQRGGTPIAYDRVLATLFGHKAISMVATHDWNQLVVMRCGETDMVPIESVANKQRLMEHDDPLIGMARALGTCLGD
jgi:ATP-dependent phosphofructokinase / diphosphate-dependent phosphofructokinase